MVVYSSILFSRIVCLFCINASITHAMKLFYRPGCWQLPVIDYIHYLSQCNSHISPSWSWTVVMLTIILRLNVMCSVMQCFKHRIATWFVYCCNRVGWVASNNPLRDELDSEGRDNGHTEDIGTLKTGASNSISVDISDCQLNMVVDIISGDPLNPEVVSVGDLVDEASDYNPLESEKGVSDIGDQSDINISVSSSNSPLV